MASINSFFGRKKSDGTFDLRISANKNRADTVGGRVALKKPYIYCHISMKH